MRSATAKSNVPLRRCDFPPDPLAPLSSERRQTSFPPQAGPAMVRRRILHYLLPALSSVCSSSPLFPVLLPSAYSPTAPLDPWNQRASEAAAEPPSRWPEDKRQNGRGGLMELSTRGQLREQVLYRHGSSSMKILRSDEAQPTD